MLFIAFFIVAIMSLALLGIIENAIVSWQGPQRPVAGYMQDSAHITTCPMWWGGEVEEEIMCHSDDCDHTTMVRHPAHHGTVVHVRTNWLGMDTTRARMRRPGYKLSLVHKGEGGFELSKIGECWRGHRGTGHDPRYKEHRRAYQPRTGWQG